jgi:hypothetical protein
MKGFALLLVAASLAAAPVSAQTPLRVGQTVTGTLESGDARMEDVYFDAYVIRGRPGERVVVRMVSDDFDTYLRWGNEQDGEWEDQNSDDDGGEGTDSRLVVTLGEEGQYELHAAGFGEDAVGAYTLSVSEPVAATPERIRLGQTVEGEITESDAEGEYGFEDHYVLTGRQGDVVTIFVDSDEIDTYLSFGVWEDGAYREMAEDDDAGVGTNAQLVVELEESGEYRLIVRSFLGEDMGPYTLRVQEGAAEFPQDEEDFDEEEMDEELFEESEFTYEGSVIGPVQAGREVNGTLGEGADEDEEELVQYYHDYTYRAAAGERLTIRVSSDEIDSYVAIGTGAGDDFAALAEDDDSGELLNARLEHEVEDAGEYIIRVTSAFPDRGSYVLLVERER